MVQPSPTQASLEQATPEEQAQYEQAYDNASKLLFAPESQKALRAAFDPQEDDPAGALASFCAPIMFRVVESAAQSGVNLADAVITEVMEEIVEDAGEMALKAKLAPMDQKVVDQAFIQTADLYRAMAQKAGLVDQEKVNQAWGQMQGKAQQAAPQQQGQRPGGIMRKMGRP